MDYDMDPMNYQLINTELADPDNLSKCKSCNEFKISNQLNRIKIVTLEYNLTKATNQLIAEKKNNQIYDKAADLDKTLLHDLSQKLKEKDNKIMELNKLVEEMKNELEIKTQKIQELGDIILKPKRDQFKNSKSRFSSSINMSDYNYSCMELEQKNSELQAKLDELQKKYDNFMEIGDEKIELIEMVYSLSKQEYPDPIPTNNEIKNDKQEIINDLKLKLSKSSKYLLTQQNIIASKNQKHAEDLQKLNEKIRHQEKVILDLLDKDKLQRQQLIDLEKEKRDLMYFNQQSINEYESVKKQLKMFEKAAAPDYMKILKLFFKEMDFCMKNLEDMINFMSNVSEGKKPSQISSLFAFPPENKSTATKYDIDKDEVVWNIFDSDFLPNYLNKLSDIKDKLTFFKLNTAQFRLNYLD